MLTATEADIEVDGFAIVERVVPDEVIDTLIGTLGDLQSSDANRRHNGRTFGVRHLLRDQAIVRALAASTAIRSLIEPILGKEVIAVRGILFDKTPGANWTVPWHQDLSIAVMQRAEVAGYGPWSMKADVPHVQPPVAVLQNMLTLRLHLDDCGPDNGPLLVLPGSHAHGVLSPTAVEEHRRTGKAVQCTLSRGSALLMRPLLLHASHSANSPAHRRVVHIEFAWERLPEPLKWFIA
jgi:ectoine hydroxylase-related dioxygenase (phytanoyl-CoA dioxygenase family)